jgi:hypothetical protein
VWEPRDGIMQNLTMPANDAPIATLRRHGWK